MTNILNKPYADKEYADFICENQGLNRYEDDNCIIMYADSEMVEDGKVVVNPNYEQEQIEKEKVRIANLKMTPRDFLIALQGLGISFEDVIEPLLASNSQARLELNYCQYVYRGNALLDALCGTLGITPEQLDNLFKEKGK